MDSMEYVKGTCTSMCPIKEAKMRESQRLLHIFEMIPGTEKDKLPKVDLKRAVKSFARSAAGKQLTYPEALRPIPVLMETINYLLEKIIIKDDKWIFIYNFIHDRLRSVRQDIIVQNIPEKDQICVLEPIVRFYAYSAYRSCDDAVNEFDYVVNMMSAEEGKQYHNDPYLNNTNLQECLKKLLVIYSHFDTLEEPGSKNRENSEILLEQNRPYFESLYLIFNLGDVDAIDRALRLPWRRSSPLVILALDISLNYIKKNYIRVCRLFKRLPLTLQMVAYTHMNEIRRCTFHMMNMVHRLNIPFPYEQLVKLLLYSCRQELISDCKFYGLKTGPNGVYLNSPNLKAQKVIARRNIDIDKKLLELDLPSLLLIGDPTQILPIL